MDIVKSKNGTAIRLTAERWVHIEENHDDLAGFYYEVLDAIANPQLIIKGWEDELLAIKEIERRYLAVVYKEVTKKDGFVITAFFTSKIAKLKKRGVIWQAQ